ncbi:hypothetical protein QBE54_01195 [Thermatribacter velox]|jgi:hypothetical protein|uniref:Glycosyltransferase RgtA/B/C/D-like domain-containing protein n=1 Tax=Thermatribacter velox TaxID=3039681 RepID=A0ABZ2YBJ3_9BACT
MKKSLRIAAFVLFLASFWVLFSLFALWAQREGLLSPEAYFLSFWANAVHREGVFNLKTFFLTYPTLPFLLSIFAPGAPFVVSACGVLGVAFASRWVFGQDTLLESLLFMAFFTSPLFLSSLCSSPILTLFVTLLAGAFFAILRHREWGLTHCLFASGFLLGAVTLTYPRFRCIMVALAAIVLLFPGSWSKKLGLLLVLFFPIFSLLGTLAFLYWIYDGNPLGFLDLHSQSFAFYFNFASLGGLQKTVAELSKFWPFFLPFVWAILSERKRFLWGLGALFSGILALPVFSLMVVFLTQVSGVLEWRGERGWVKAVNVLLLCVFVILSWGRFVVDSRGFFFHLYPRLEEKLAEYRKLEELVQGKVLVMEPASFLVSSWKDMDRVWTPELRNPNNSFYADFANYDYLITSENSLGLPGFELAWKGRELRLYRRLDVLAVDE